MKRNTTTACSFRHPPSAIRYRSRERGSVIILVVVVLTLMALMGAAYLQLARADRAATAQISGSNIDRVITAQIVYIGDVLVEDLIDDQGRFFMPWDSGNTTTGDEPYDYPWTNSGNTFATPLGNAVGGREDDTWLASASPDFQTSATVPRWTHITNLNGIFLRMPKTTGSERFPDEHVVDHSGRFNTDSTVSGTIHNKITGDTQSMDANDTVDWEATGVDADGDGIPDSRWTWAKLQQISGVTYVVAMRIVDNSSMINVNTATAMTADGDVTILGGEGTPRGYYPTSMDLSRLLSRESHGGTSGTNEWAGQLATNADSLFDLRGVDDDIDVATPFGPVALSTFPNPGSYTALTGRLGQWLDRGTYHGYSANRLSIQDEFELRYHNGLNRLSNTTTLKTRMSTVLRNTMDETVWSDVTGSATVGSMRDFFQGGTGDIDARNFPDVRKMLTAYSGANIVAANYPASSGDLSGIYSGDLTTQYDLVFRHIDASGNYDEDLNTNNIPDRVEDIATRLDKVLKIGTTPYLGLTVAEIDEIIAEYALAIQDYSDNNIDPTNATIGTKTYYGLEMVPFIREVYLQVGYADTDQQDTDGDWPTNTPGPWDSGSLDADGNMDTWERNDSTRCMAIELGNPFDRTITGTGATAEARMLDGRIQIVVRNPTTATDIATYTFDNTAPDVPSRGHLVVYSNPVVTFTEGGAGADLPVDLGFSGDTPAPHDAGIGTLVFPISSDQIEGDDITIELRINTDPGGTANWVTYDRFTLADEIGTSGSGHGPVGVPQYIAHENLDTTVRNRFVQLSVARDGQNIRYLANTGKDLLNVRQHPDTSGTSDIPIDWPAGSPSAADYRYQSNNPVDRLTFDTKTLVTPAVTITGDATLDFYQIPVANRPIFSVAELAWIQMFGFYTDTGDVEAGDFPSRFTTPGGPNALAVNRRVLNASGTLPDATGIPHAAMVFDQFTTLSPEFDFVDNDNRDKDDTTTTGVDEINTPGTQAPEWFVQGRMNINTATLEAMTLGAPMPEVIDDVQTLFEQIVAYRDDPTRRNADLTPFASGVRANGGISSIGELIAINPNIVAGGTNYEQDMLRYTSASENIAQPAEMDLYPMDEEETAGATRYTNAMEVEGAMARFQFLSQAFTTRSDIYTAYILVQGYASGDFSLGPVESKRVAVIFDRSNIEKLGDKPRIIGIFED